MASLPSVAVNGTLKLDNDLRKKHPSLNQASFKSPNVSYPKHRRDGAFESASMDFREALSSMRNDASSDSCYYTGLLQQCVAKNSASEVEIVHTQIIKFGFFKDSFVSTTLVNVYVKCGAMESARKVLDDMPSRSFVVWTTLMTGYVRNSQTELALQAFQEMLLDGVYPTNFTVGIALNACSSLQSIRTIEQIHGYIAKCRFGSDASIGNSLCSLYSKSGHMGSCVKAFEEIEERDVISWTAVISACGSNGDASMGLSFFVEMLSEGSVPNVFTLTSVLSLCCVTLSSRLGTQVHSLTFKLGLDSNLRVKNSIMYLYLRTGNVPDAKRLFDKMKVNSLVTWNAMIAGHSQMMERELDDLAKHRSGNEALRIFSKLNRTGMKPDLYTFSSLFTVCAGLAALEQGEQVHARTIKSGFLSDVVVGTTLINMYSKCGSLEKASKVFVEMSTRTLISWTAMITSLAQHGKSREALRLFDDMRFSGLRPNHVTFVGVLSACSHAGLVNEALTYFEAMQREYRIKPVMDHYACLVDMFLRLGRVEEAFGVVETMDFEPSKFIWSSLVAGCRSHRKPELGFYAAEQLLKLRPKESEPYVLLLNMYLSTQRWQDVSRVRRVMREEGIAELKDWSWISIKDKVYSFKAADPSDDLVEYLESLAEKARGLGYRKIEDLEVTDEEEEEEKRPVHHSEKLAIAFGLLNGPSYAPIRVKKNYVMCRDCHNFIKAVSAATKREFTVRDSRRLHRFVDGKCSCGDFGSHLL